MTKAISKVDDLKKSVQAMEKQFAHALPTHIKASKFIRVLNTAVTNTPNLASADKRSFFAACLKSAQDGLLPDGKEAALIPFKDQVTYVPMVAGILKKLRNSGKLKSIATDLVYENDEFTYWTDEKGKHFKHKPNFFGARGEIIGAYAMAETTDGGVYIEPMTNEQIAAVEKVSKGKGGPWNGPFRDQMIRKTVLKRLAKMLPMSSDVMETINADNELYDLEPTDETPEAPVEKDVTQPSRLEELVSNGSDGPPKMDSQEEIPL